MIISVVVFCKGKVYEVILRLIMGKVLLKKNIAKQKK